jgi:hypothetical protein
MAELWLPATTRRFKTGRPAAGRLGGMDTMLTNLTADGRHPDLPEPLDLYERLLGSWHIANRLLDEATGEWHESTLEWHFGRTLDGLGVQDVLRGRSGAGTTVRVFDLRQQLWRVGWYGPVSGEFATLVGRPEGDTIAQEGTGTDGRPIRWTFTEISPDRFHWQGYIADDSGTTWRLEQEMLGRRR